ncbi:hypothetical protein [Streptomyces sp. NPDC021622]|uniref:hypothetical protein n=1 Tax=Streptomyces sp. NPDC021622 TaxID=3155013 RepID=UPI0033EB1DCE
MSIEMLAGEAAEGLRVADHIDTSQLPSLERRFTFGLELARRRVRPTFRRQVTGLAERLSLV